VYYLAMTFGLRFGLVHSRTYDCKFASAGVADKSHEIMARRQSEILALQQAP